MTVTIPDTGRTSCRLARRTLRIPGVRLRLIFLIIFLVTFWVGSIFVCESLFYGIPWSKLHSLSPALYQAVSVGRYVVDGAVILFLGLPLAWGALMGVMDTAAGRPFRYTVLFTAFSGGRIYRRALLVLLSYLLRYGVLLGLFGGGIWLAMQIPPRSPVAYGVILLILILSALILVLGSLFLCRDDAVLYLAWRYPEWNIRTLYTASHRIMREHVGGEWLFRLSFAGWFLASVPTLFLLLIFHTLPYRTLASAYRAAGLAEEADLPFPMKNNDAAQRPEEYLWKNQSFI